MARTANKNSTRQKAFTYLDELPSSTTRPQAVINLQNMFNINESYSKSLYQSHRMHRNNIIDNKNFVTIYTIRDTYKNLPAEPYLTKQIKRNPNASKARTPMEAILQYQKDNDDKSKKAAKLIVDY